VTSAVVKISDVSTRAIRVSSLMMGSAVTKAPATTYSAPTIIPRLWAELGST